MICFSIVYSHKTGLFHGVPDTRPRRGGYEPPLLGRVGASLFSFRRQVLSAHFTNNIKIVFHWHNLSNNRFLFWKLKIKCLQKC